LSGYLAACLIKRKPLSLLPVSFFFLFLVNHEQSCHGASQAFDCQI